VGEDDLQSSILTVNGFATGVSTAAVTVAVLDTPKQYVTRKQKAFMRWPAGGGGCAFRKLPILLK
jgi:hypothetical protein